MHSDANLGLKALYQIATIPEEHREEKQQTSSGEMKTPYEMTNKEREEFKRQLKQRDAFIGCGLFYLQNVKTLYFRKF